MTQADSTRIRPGTVIFSWALARRKAPKQDGLESVMHLLDMIGPLAPRVLVPEPVRQRMAALPSFLRSLGHIAGFECRLGHDEDRVDLQLCVVSAAGGAEAVERALPAIHKAAASEGGGWVELAGFLEEWIRPGSLLSQHLPVIWLELDEDAANDRYEVPFVVFTFDQPINRGGEVGDVPVRDVLFEGLCLAAGRDLEPSTSALLDNCLAELPPSARVFHAAVRPVGTSEVVRLIVRLPWRTYPPFLSRVGWPGSVSDLQAFLERYCSRTLMHSVHLDIGAGIGPRIAMEFRFPSSPRLDPRWVALFDLLGADGACSREKRDAAVAWWNMDAGEATERDLLVKVLYEPGQPIRAKAYLPFAQRVDLLKEPSSRLIA